MPDRIQAKHRVDLPIAMPMVAVVVLLSLSGGCSRYWQSQSESSSTTSRSYALPAPRMAPDSVALEIAVVTLDGKRLETFDKVWQQADMQSLPLATRKILDQNGIRAGVLGNQLPGELTEALSWTQPLLNEDGQILSSSKSPLPQIETAGAYSIRQIEQLQPGEEHWVPCSTLKEQLAWSIEVEQQRRSGICELARSGFLLSHVPGDDQSVDLLLRPIIQYGESKLRYGVDQDTFLAQEKQKTLHLNELDFVQRLRLGQTMVVSATPMPTGTGQQFFASGRFSVARQVLLIRPLQIGRDDLFAPERTTRRLSTSLD